MLECGWYAPSLARLAQTLEKFCHEIKPAVDGNQASNWRREQRRHSVAPLLPWGGHSSHVGFLHISPVWGELANLWGSFLRG